MAGYRISLRYKLALPVAISVFGILVLLTHMTIRLARDFAIGTFKAEISSEVDTFARSIRSPFLLRDFHRLQARLDGLSARQEVYGVQIVDPEWAPILQAPVFRKLPTIREPFLKTYALFPHRSLLSILLYLEEKRSEGRFQKFPDLFVATSSLSREGQILGRVQIFFTTHPLNEMIRKIYRQRILFSFLAAMGIAFLTSVVTWLAIRPLFRLKRTVQDILTGQMGIRARIHSGDEIEDLADAFNEMLGRLEQSLKNLHLRTEALEESEEKYRALVENASDVIWLLSPEGKIIFINQDFGSLSRENLIQGGLPLFLSFHTEDSIEKFSAALAQVKKDRTPVNHVITTFHHPQTHSEIFYSTNLTPVLTHQRQLKAFQAVSRDVTELKRIEMMKDRLIHDVAHELKTPVAKFQMTLSWLEKELQKEFEGSRYRDVLDLMKRNADLLMKMITEVMDLSRLEAGTERLVGKPCDLTQILTRVSEDLEPLVRQKNLTLERKGLAIPLLFEGDETMLYRLFSNLVINAMKFTSQGKIEVALEKKEGRIRASVKDTGMGLEKEDLGRVFDRFFQKTPATPGMGLGLALAREITVLHGGQIWAESEGLGKGSTFIVEFPA